VTDAAPVFIGLFSSSCCALYFRWRCISLME
jgi:hypothetical protein